MEAARLTVAASALSALRISTPPIPIVRPDITVDARCAELYETSPRRRTKNFYCFRCGCKGKISKFATVHGKGKVVPSHCACAQCDGGAHCVFSNIDQCIVCSEHYELDESRGEFCCHSRCPDPALSSYAQRFLSLSVVDINSPLPPWKRTLLHSAVAAGDSGLCWHLLRRGANPFACDYLGVSPLALATSMLPEEDELNCSADHSYKSAIDIYHILPKMHAEAFEYIEHLCPRRKMDRGFSMGDYHPSSTDRFGGFSPPTSVERDACGPVSLPIGSSGTRGRGDSTGSLGNSPLRSHKEKKKAHHSRRARSSSLHESVLSKNPNRHKCRKPRVGKTWADVVARACRKDPVQAIRAHPSTILQLPSHKDIGRYSAAVKRYTNALRDEGKTPVLLDSGLQTFTPLTITRLMDTAIDTYDGAGGPKDSEMADRLLSGDIFVIEEDGNKKPSTSPRTRGASRDYIIGSPRRERSSSQTSIGSPGGRGRTRSQSINENIGSRRRTYSEAEQGGSRVLLRHCTLYELKRAILENDAVHGGANQPAWLSAGSELDDGNDDLLFSCTACMDYLKPSEFAFTCHRMGCNGNLCRDCLYRSLVVSVTSALYAVPMVRCPGKCHGRVPTNAWIHQLDSIIPSAEEIESLVVTTTETTASLLEGMRMAMNRCLEMELELYHNADSEDTEHHCQIMERACSEFFVKSRQLLRLHGACMDHVYMYAQDMNCALDEVSAGLGVFSTLPLLAEKLRSQSGVDRWPYGLLYKTSRYDMHDKLQELMSAVVAEDIKSGDNTSCVSRLADILVTFIIHIDVSKRDLLAAAESELSVWDKKEASLPALTARELLLGRYQHNAEALLMMRCGKCDKSVSLLYQKNIPTSMAARQQVLSDFLWPHKEEDQIALLRAFAAFTCASIAPSTFISSLFCVWAKIRPPSLVQLCDSGVLHVDLGTFMESVIGLLVDVERRLAAQLALYRAYPKIYTACCGAAHCFMCKVKGHHASKTCEEVQSALVGEEAQYCPGCGVPTLRTEGCHQILCVCGMSWQWRGGDDPNDVNYNFNDGGSDSFNDDSSDSSFDESDSDDDEGNDI